MIESPPSRVAAEQLRLRLLTDADDAVVAAFSCGESDLDEFLRTDAQRLSRLRVVRTYLAFFDVELVGFLSVLNDAIVLETRERKKLDLGSQGHPVVPALKIARLAVSETFRSRHSGVGTGLLRVALALALDLSDRVGCRLLTVDAYPGSVSFYEKLGFLANGAKLYEGRRHPSMRLDIFPRVPHPWAS